MEIIGSVGCVAGQTVDRADTDCLVPITGGSSGITTRGQMPVNTIFRPNSASTTQTDYRSLSDRQRGNGSLDPS